MIACDLASCHDGLRPEGGVCSWCAGKGRHSLRGLADLLRCSPSALRRLLDPKCVMKPATASLLLDRILRLQRHAEVIASVQDRKGAA